MIRFLQSCALLLSITLLSASALAAEWAGTVKAMNGTVQVERNGQQSPLSVGDKLYPLDKVITARDSHVAITLRDDTLISGSANTQLVINEFAFNPSTQNGGVVISVVKGIAAFVSGLVAKSSPTAMRVTTPTATLGIRGTEFIVDLGN